jgi:hypothetical protein
LNANDIAAVAAPGGGVDLYISVSATQQLFPAEPDPGTIEEIADSAAFNATFAPSTPTVLYGAPSGDMLYGISPAPTVPEPLAVGIFAVGATRLLSRRRRN